MLDAADLPDDIAALKAMLIAARLSEAAKDVAIASKDEHIARKDERIERLEKLVAAFKQAAFGRKSEKTDPDQSWITHPTSLMPICSATRHRDAKTFGAFKDGKIEAFCIDEMIAELRNTPLFPRPGFSPAGNQTHSRLTLLWPDVIVLHMLRAYATHSKRLRIVRMLHVMNIAHINAFAHFAFLRRRFKIIDTYTSPPLVWNSWRRPLAPTGMYNAICHFLAFTK